MVRHNASWHETCWHETCSLKFNLTKLEYLEIREIHQTERVYREGYFKNTGYTHMLQSW